MIGIHEACMGGEGGGRNIVLDALPIFGLKAEPNYSWGGDKNIVLNALSIFSLKTKLNYRGRVETLF